MIDLNQVFYARHVETRYFVLGNTETRDRTTFFLGACIYRY